MKLSTHKNAIAGGLIGGIGGGQLVLELLDAFTNVHPDARQAALITGAVSTITLLAARPLRYLWQHGVRGSWRRLLDGSAGAEPPERIDPAPGSATLTAGERVQLMDAVSDYIRQTLGEPPPRPFEPASREQLDQLADGPQT